MGWFDFLPWRKRRLALEDKKAADEKVKSSTEILGEIKRVLNLVNSVRNDFALPVALEEFEHIRMENGTGKEFYKTYLELLETKARNFLDTTHVIEGRLVSSQRQIDKVKKEINRVKAFESVLVSKRVSSLKQIIQYEVAEGNRRLLTDELERIEQGIDKLTHEVKTQLDEFEKEFNARLKQLESKVEEGKKIDLDELENMLRSFISDVVQAKAEPKELHTDEEYKNQMKEAAKVLEAQRNNLVRESERINAWLRESRELAEGVGEYVQIQIKEFEKIRESYREHRVALLAFINDIKTNAKIESEGYYKNKYDRIIKDLYEMKILYEQLFQAYRHWYDRGRIQGTSEARSLERGLSRAKKRLFVSKRFGMSGEKVFETFQNQVWTNFEVLKKLCERKIRENQELGTDNAYGEARRLEDLLFILEEKIKELNQFINRRTSRDFFLDPTYELVQILIITRREFEEYKDRIFDLLDLKPRKRKKRKA